MSYVWCDCLRVSVYVCVNIVILELCRVVIECVTGHVACMNARTCVCLHVCVYA